MDKNQFFENSAGNPSVTTIPAIPEIEELITQTNKEILEQDMAFAEEFEDDQLIYDDPDEYAPTSKNQYKSKIGYHAEVNKPIMAIFFNYFNILSHKRTNENITEIDGVTFKGNVSKDEIYISYLPDYPPATFTYKTILKVNGNNLIFSMTAYKEGPEIRNVIRMSSLDDDSIKSHEMYNFLFKRAVDASNLKGSYLTISDKVLDWKVRELKNLSFDDVFLPEDLMSDLNLYPELFKSKKILLRYMFSGVPGTGKTESTRAISKILNLMGVTIIKTNICPIIEQKFELAKLLAPCVIILDDIDLFLGDRNHGDDTPLLGKFLDILDGVDKLPANVGIIASTNAPHLIDLAAQRPGRFNKLLFFDELTIDNIRNIIKKSLDAMSNEFGNVTKHDIKVLTSDKLVDYFKEQKYTGAFIFETVKNIKFKSEILNTELDLDKIISEITKNKQVLDNKLKTSRIDSNLSSKPKKLGY